MAEEIEAATAVYGAILAGGAGTRMGNPDKPKQFLMLGGKPVLVHTVEKFAISGLFDAILVLCPPDWVDQTRDLLRRYCECGSDAIVVPGGAKRNDTIMNAIDYIRDHLPVDEDSILVTHDAVRPFVTHRILQENLRAARQHGACDTVMPATDTIVESQDGRMVDAIPARSILYQGQTPQTFRVLELGEVLGSLDEGELSSLTDACKAYVLRGRPVALVKGDSANMKITYPEDMRIAASLLGEAHA